MKKYLGSIFIVICFLLVIVSIFLIKDLKELRLADQCISIKQHSGSIGSIANSDQCGRYNDLRASDLDVLFIHLVKGK